MGLRAHAYAWGQSHITPADKLVLVKLADGYSEGNEEPRHQPILIDRIAAYCCMTQEEAAASLRRLADAGLITLHHNYNSPFVGLCDAYRMGYDPEVPA